MGTYAMLNPSCGRSCGDGCRKIRVKSRKIAAQFEVSEEDIEGSSDGLCAVITRSQGDHSRVRNGLY